METKRVRFTGLRDLPITAIARASMEWNLTGHWRHLRPVYEEKLSPCMVACPAGVDVRGFIHLLAQGNAQAAWETIKADNPFPGVCGRVCYHPCESECNRKDLDEVVAINALERYAYDRAARGTRLSPQGFRPRKERVAIVGSGPAGLSCAYHVARLGYQVTAFEELPQPGGILRYGIPEYRLPRAVLDDEIKDVVALGVKIVCGKRLGANLSVEELDRFDAVFLATGAHVQANLGIQQGEQPGVWGGLELLRRVRDGADVNIGREVAVIGGGNTAIDAARTVLRLGATPVIYYRRSRNEMPAHAEEVEEAESEGVRFEFLTAPVSAERKGQAIRLECIRMQLGEPDDSGRRRPIPIEGSNFAVMVDAVVSAVGEQCDLSFMPLGVETQKGLAVTDRWHQTGRPGYFAGGDLTQPERTVAHAIGAGKRGAVGIDSFLRGEEATVPAWGAGSGAFPMSAYLNGAKPGEDARKVVRFDELNADYFEPFERARMPKLARAQRRNTFREVNLGLPEDLATQEAQRCFVCGMCTSCENCYIYCPEMSVIMAEDGHCQIDYDYCKGCCICVVECPRSAMSITEEQAQ